MLEINSKRESFRCRTEPEDKVSVHGDNYTERVYVMVTYGGKSYDVSLPPGAARGLATAINKAADWAEGKQ